MCFWLQEAERSWAEGNPLARPGRGWALKAERRRDGDRGGPGAPPQPPESGPALSVRAGPGGRGRGGDRRGCCRAGSRSRPRRRDPGLRCRDIDNELGEDDWSGDAEPGRAGQEEPGTSPAEGAPGHDELRGQLSTSLC